MIIDSRFASKAQMIDRMAAVERRKIHEQAPRGSRKAKTRALNKKVMKLKDSQ